MANKPTFKQISARSLVTQADRKPKYYPTYKFSGRTFVKLDVPGPKPS